jgi:hypothetical protein
MSNLHDLLKSLVTVCVRYHHDKLGCDGGLDAQIHTLLQKSAPEIEIRLAELILEAIKNDKTRETYLSYVHFTIKIILNFLSLEGITKDEDRVGIQLLISQFFQNSQKLLDTSQSCELTIHFNNQDVRMHGFVRRTLWASLSVLGNAVQDILFTPFRLTLTTRKEEICSFVRELFQTHSHDLLVFSLTRRNKVLQDELEGTQSLLRKEHTNLEIAQTRLSHFEQEIDKIRKSKKPVSVVNYSATLFPGLFATQRLLSTGKPVNKGLVGDVTERNPAETSTLQHD